jgi:nuclear pore complex protein Nup107
MSSRRHSREESWDSLHHSDASHGASEVEDDYADMSMDEASDDRSEGSPSGTPALLTVSDVHRALHPLQSTADRVGKQVEQFAETLDRLSTRRQRKSQKDCRHVLPLVQAYKKIASGAVEHLKSIHAPERQQQLSKKWKRKLRNSGGTSTPASPHADQEERGTKTTVEDLRRWEEEEQTWDLLGLMLEVEYPIPQSDSQRPNSFRGHTRPSRSKEVTRYSSEKAVWDSFLAHDDLAWERHTVVEWLKKCADESGQDIELVVKELESGADRGSGLWAHSWLYTKEAIKGQKRLRSWPQALESDAPGIDTSLVNSDRTKALVTQLDPDAITRQGRSLEKQDHYFEQATWLACWEMVRRGKDWDYIREWCQERVEGWRATLMRGDPRNSQSKEDHPGPDVTTGWRSRALWRKTCALAAKTGGIDPYENAVYGVLGGYLPSVLKVSRSWDDYLFAHYNLYLLSQFDRYVKSHFSDRLSTALLQKHGCYDFSVSEGHRTHSGNQIVQKMKTLEATKKEAKRPFKMLQSSLIAKTFDDFVFKQGVKLCQAANTPERSKILPAMSATLLEGSITAPIGMKDYDLLRVVTHMLLIFQDLGLDIGEGNRRFATESIVVAYVDYLSKAGKQQLLPLYASFLSHDRSTTCLGRQLPFIKDHRERQTVMRLMKQCGIDVPGVLNMQLQMIIRDSPEKGDSKTFPALAILEPNNHDKSRVRPIQSAFVGDSISDDEQDLINGFEWYMLLEGHWQQTMTTGGVLYKHLLRKS